MPNPKKLSLNFTINGIELTTDKKVIRKYRFDDETDKLVKKVSEKLEKKSEGITQNDIFKFVFKIADAAIK